MFVSRYLLLFCFFTALCTNAAKNANERVCEMPSLAKTPGLQRNTQTLFTRLANPARHPSLILTEGILQNSARVNARTGKDPTYA
ncbi:hypothetical protein L596_019010 [Steinernema carpocapsae]|uniref:Uncharacterized protein n=1 Tax=Steinernema carpocapsae TaxID=34508 RepID=A0A4U5N6D0_STECR|nr:hypothetical protein L596_019010 [Steinernema carpocapsae]